MFKETLTCHQCGSSWNRKQARGRKPRLCFQCLQQPVLDSVNINKNVVIIDSSLKTPSVKILETTKKVSPIIYPGKNIWRCQVCKEELKTHVGLSEQPMHWCRLKSNAYVPLDLVRTQKI